MLGAHDPRNTPIWIKFVAGSISGGVASLIGNPADTLKTRMQAWEGKSHSIVWHAKAIYNDVGIHGFYRGLQAAIIRAMILNAS